MTVFPILSLDVNRCEGSKTMGDKVLCQDVLEQLLEEKVGEAGTAGGKSAVSLHI